MGLFFKKKNSDANVVFAPIKGKVVDITTLKDQTFATKVMGDGIAIIPNEGKVYSPIDGSITALLESKHAYGLVSDDGFELLIHIGQDTVKLNGEGFTCNVKEGQKVKKGDLLGTFDIELIKSKGYEIATPIILIEGDYLIKEKTNLKDIDISQSLFTIAKK